MQSILIIGAGPTGLAAAVELKRRGFQPRIVDKASGHPAESRALAVNARTLRILEASSLTDRFLEQGNCVSNFHLTEGDDKTIVRFDLSAEPPPYNFIVILPQADTERILAAGLREQGIEIEWETSVTDLRLENDRAIVSLGGESGTETVQPDIVVGADGAHSLVRKSLGIEFEGERQVDPFGLVDVRFSEPVEANELRLRFYPEGLLGFFPITDRIGRFVSTVPKLLESLPPEYPVGERLWETEFAVSFRHVDRFQKGNVFLVGDAAHIHSPVGGRGMNLGIEDAAWLAWLLSVGRESDFTADRLPTAKQVLRFTKMQTKQVSSRGPFASFVRRNLVPLILGVPPVRRRAIQSLRALDTPVPPWLS